jgi:protein involved in polysaccharide export with SLBB domain
MQSSSLFAWIAVVFCLLALRMEDRAAVHLEPGDQVRITVGQAPELTTDAKLEEDGSIRFPPLGRVQLAGLSRVLAESYIADRLLEQGAEHAQQVHVQVVRDRPVRLADASAP